ncbi:MAG: imidazoleglycerol-phosphate dehydratase, partial [Candidatus Omnitrophota bacterium]
ELFAFWGLFDLDITAKGDLNVGIHHTNEDIGIELGKAFKKALGEKEGIRRISSVSVPMEEVVAKVVLDISGRGSYKFGTGKYGDAPQPQEGYSLSDAEHFFEAFSKSLGTNLIITIDPLVNDLHTTLEPVFKALGIALDEATQIDPRRKGVSSSKGVID